MRATAILLIFAGLALHASLSQNPAPEPPALLKLLQDRYQIALDRELAGVREAYRQELLKVKEGFTSAGDLDSALAVEAELKGEDRPGKPARLAAAKESYHRAVERVAGSLRPAYVRELTALRADLTKAGKLADAVAVDHELKAQTAAAGAPAGTTANPAAKGLPAGALVIEALIDGPSELRVQRDSIHWLNEANAKPGRHNGKKEPTYVNDLPWHPEWENPADRGDDKSKPYPLPARFDSNRLDFKLISVSTSRGVAGIEQRDPIKARGVGSDYSVYIPDKLSGARWYKFAIFPKGAR
jgi:hypothetical protein